MQQTPAAPNRILRKPAVVERVGLSGTTIWRLVRANNFPAPLKLSANAIGWIEADVEEWIAQRAAGTRAGQ